MSHQDAATSSSLSTGLTVYFNKAVIYLTGNDSLDFRFFHFLARKSAHFTAYFVLSILIYRAMPRFTIKHGIYSLGLTILYAMSDEFHQTFIFGRSGELRDVLIDSLGGLFGIVVFSVIKQSLYKKRQQISRV